MMQVCNANLRPSLNDVQSYVSSELNSLMQRCWDKDPTVRPSISEILETLNKQYESM